MYWCQIPETSKNMKTEAERWGPVANKESADAVEIMKATSHDVGSEYANKCAICVTHRGRRRIGLMGELQSFVLACTDKSSKVDRLTSGLPQSLRDLHKV